MKGDIPSFNMSYNSTPCPKYLQRYKGVKDSHNLPLYILYPSNGVNVSQVLHDGGAAQQPLGEEAGAPDRPRGPLQGGGAGQGSGGRTTKNMDLWQRSLAIFRLHL